jgi:rhodanese-related sulfurtransferase
MSRCWLCYAFLYHFNIDRSLLSRYVKNTTNGIERFCFLPAVPHLRLLFSVVIYSRSHGHFLHSIFYLRIKCCVDQLNPPHIPDPEEMATSGKKRYEAGAPTYSIGAVMALWYIKADTHFGREGMAETYAQMEERAISSANAVTATKALKLLASDPDALLVDVRDESEVEATGLGLHAITAPGRSIAWMADLKSEYKSQELQDRSRLILTTCGGSPNYRGTSAENVLTRMGFTNVSFVDGGMAALLTAGIITK